MLAVGAAAAAGLLAGAGWEKGRGGVSGASGAGGGVSAGSGGRGGAQRGVCGPWPGRATGGQAEETGCGGGTGRLRRRGGRLGGLRHEGPGWAGRALLRLGVVRGVVMRSVAGMLEEGEGLMAASH